ncbi:RNA-directed DNA polymerase, eukaryota [Tanacetum coccineum]|uniref:RNA-directed DNA polymerase, eukaryota n=1 Tax=Tanacetum coccineum TaxID=301880 RepID=A0ABQ5FMP8_9ASTR
MSSFRSKEDHVIRLSKSIFVTNFPENFGSSDLWKLCEAYGKVVDVYIPNRKSKAGKRFAFVRFIKVDDVDRLVSNLCTLWVGRFHLRANVVRFERPTFNPKPAGYNKLADYTQPKIYPSPGSFVNVVKGNHSNVSFASVPDSPSLVLDDSCVNVRDLSRHVMGKVKDLSSIPNLRILLTKEGFPETQMTYLGGLWVMIELVSESTRNNFLRHTGVKSWFHVIQLATHDFVSDERVVWVDIEGVPLNLWSRETFLKIGKKWGESMDIEENLVSSFSRKRVYIKTNRPDNILEKFKITHRGKVYMARAKELFAWTPIFLDYIVPEYISDDEVLHSAGNNSVGPQHGGEYFIIDSDVDGVLDTIFDNIHVSPANSGCQSSKKAGEQKSKDLFGIYDLLNKHPKGVAHESDPSLSYPPGFTPELPRQEDDFIDDGLDNGIVKENSPSVHSQAMNSSEEFHVNEVSKGHSESSRSHYHKGGLILELLDDMVRVGKSMGYEMEGCLGYKTEKEWVKELNVHHKVNFLALQETKMDRITHMDVKCIWGNSNYQFVSCDSVGNSGGILCIWEANVFKKANVTISDNFIVIYGTWSSNNLKVLIVVVYAPQSTVLKRALWEYISLLISRWDGESIVMGDFNEVRSIDERLCSVFNHSSACIFNHFIETLGLVDVNLEGYSFTWSHPSASKMSKLDRFLVSEGIFSFFPSISALCLDRHLSDHRPILLREVFTDFGPTPFRFYHSWFKRDGFDDMVEHAWNSFSYSDSNRLIRFKKKLQELKVIIRQWIKDKNLIHSGAARSIKEKLIDIDKTFDSGNVSNELRFKRMELSRQLHDLKQMEATDWIQKSKIKWAIEGDENSKFFHGTINKKRSQLSIRGVLIDGHWKTDPEVVKDAFKDHFANRFKQPGQGRFKLNFEFPNRLSNDQVEDLDRCISNDEIRRAVWDCGVNKSPGPDGYTFEFFRRYWNFIGPDFCSAVDCFFESGTFPMGSNASFIALIPKVTDAILVSDFRPISLIGSVYKVVTKILANRLATVISVLVSDTQSAFAYDSVRWDYLLDVLHAFGFGPNWCKWIRGTFSSSMASVLVNGSPSSEFPFFCGLKQGDPLAPYLFILIMESLHISFSKALSDGVFKGIQINESMVVSHLFYADDAIFIGEWSDSNMGNIVKILRCFFLASGLKINIQKSQIMGVGVHQNQINQAASLIGCSVMQAPFRYLGVTVCLSFLLDPIPFISYISGCPSGKLKRSLLEVWRFISQDGSLWYRVIQALYGSSFDSHSVQFPSLWCSILREMYALIPKGFNFVSHCKKQIGDGSCSRFWYDPWTSDQPLRTMFPRIFALETNKDSTVEAKLRFFSVETSLRRPVRDGAERQQWDELCAILDPVILSSSKDRWICDLSGDGAFRVKEARLDRLPTRSNLARRGIVMDSDLCPVCGLVTEDITHVLFRCDLAGLTFRKICRWWELDWQVLMSFEDWNDWFSAIRLSSNVKLMLEGVCYVAWWHIWAFRNHLIFDATPPRRSMIFDDIVSRSYYWHLHGSDYGSNSKTQLSRKIKVFQSDGGTEFVNHTVRKIFEDNGTLHRLSCPYTPQQNGRAERKHSHLLKTGFAMLFHAHDPSSIDDNPPTDSDDVSSHGAPPAPPATAPTEPSSVHQMKTRSKSGIFKTKHSPDFVSLTSHALHAALFSLVQPKGFKSAAKHPQWMAAMHDEMEALKQNCTWTLVPRPSASNIVGSKWVYRIKYHADGSVERFKARVVAQGFTQIPGLDYSHTFSPVVKASTVRIVLSLAVLHRWRLHQLDVKNAFLHGHLNETVYMEQPPGFIDPQFPNHVCKLSKALYGLKQAPRAWFHRLSSFLLAHGFVCSRADTSLFVFTKDSCIMYLLVYVDDLILTGNNESLLTSFTTRLNQEFAIKDLGDLSYFLGLEVSYTNDGLFLSQAKYATDVLTRAALLDSKPVSTPLAANEVFVTGGSLFANPTLYRSLVGALQYLTITRPDLSYAVNQASQFLHAPTDAHFQSVKRILRYVKGTITYGLIFRRPHSNSILGYSDADWARCIETRRSTYGYSIFLGGNLVSWSAKKQPTVSRSSCESEYRAMANTAAEIIWITHLLRELHALPPDRPTLLCDNKSALFMSQNPVSHKRAKHIDLDYHFVRELVASGKLYTKFIPTKLQVADIFTKSLPRPQFEYFRSLLRLGPPPIRLRGDIR